QGYRLFARGTRLRNRARLCSPAVGARLATGLLVGLLAMPVSAATAPEQTVTEIAPPVEQRVEGIDASNEQRVEEIDPAEAQAVPEGTSNPGTNVFRTTGKIAIGVMAAAFSLAFTAASLLFF